MIMKPYAQFDPSDFPIVIVRFTGAKAEDQNFKAYLEELHQAYQPQQPFTYLFDASQATLPGFKYQKMQADWLRDNEQLMKKYCLGTAYVIPNPLVRNVLKGILALQQQPVPHQVVSSEAEAREWCERKLSEAEARIA